ncbi:AI-2E family transporter [Actinomadura parmotrematis]|uniref:AI-2E family transporter n=1 Tax=Actinomadura parmotrematis TaxID=2864039 RepID=A0ABS7FKZ3_9ACTN|nr:AI-2E family transporter [Actinomadura parmotrematis]MBW8481038.1 AI-2E family transporter [Actinomadura parmotrematis]
MVVDLRKHGASADGAREDGGREGGGREPAVPPLLAVTAAWSWRLIAIGVVGYFLVQLMATLSVVVLSCAIALFLCALLRPLTARLERHGLPPLAATWVTLLFALTVLGGIGTYVGVQANAEFPKLASEVQVTAREMQHWLETGPLHIEHSQIENSLNEAVKYLEDRRGKLASTALQAGTLTAEVLAAAVFVLFVTFFLLKDGARIWAWTIGGTGRHRARVDRAGRAAWETLSQYVHGTVLVAAIHAVVLAIVLAVLGVPLVAPLAVVIFIGSFIPIVGILVGGALAVAVTFGAQGGTAALIFLGVLIVEHQLESHLLQPLVVGRWVRLHPLAIIIAITVGGVLGGIPGAAGAVPLVAVVYRAWPALRGTDRDTPAEDPAAPPPDRDHPVTES